MNGPALRGAASRCEPLRAKLPMMKRGVGIFGASGPNLQIVSLIDGEGGRSIRGGYTMGVCGFFATVPMLMELDRSKLPNRLIRGVVPISSINNRSCRRSAAYYWTCWVKIEIRRGKLRINRLNEIIRDRSGPASNAKTVTETGRESLRVMSARAA